MADMSWDNAMSAAIDTCYATFSEDILLEDVGVTIRGIFNAPHSVVQFGGAQVEIPDPSVEVLTEDVATHNLLDGQRVTVRGDSLTVVSQRRSDDGTTLLTLRGYR